MRTQLQLGLGGALALLAACGPGKPSSDAGDLGDDDGTTAGETGDAGESSDSGDTGMAEALCTLENYADDPQLGPFANAGCFPAEPDGTCPVCDLACMESIVYDCPLDGCGLPDLPCINYCSNHLVLCSEQLGDQCCYLVTAEYGGGVPGRPLREHGVARLPRLRVVGPACDHPDRNAAAAAYREFARYERASVDAFTYAAVLLERLGAASQLVERHRDAAREEADHARLALAAAEALDGREATLGEVPEPTDELSLTEFVRDLIHDGCIGEQIATVEAGWALTRPELRDHEALQRYWTRVARDEASHAALAWAALEWLLDTDAVLGPFVTRELTKATTLMTTRASGSGAGLEPFGIAGTDAKAIARARAIAELVSNAKTVRQHSQPVA